MDIRLLNNSFRELRLRTWH